MQTEPQSRTVAQIKLVLNLIAICPVLATAHGTLGLPLHKGGRIVSKPAGGGRGAMAGDGALSGAGSHRESRTVRERAGIFVAGVAGGKTAHEIGSQAIAASSDCRAGLVTRQQP